MPPCSTGQARLRGKRMTLPGLRRTARSSCWGASPHGPGPLFGGHSVLSRLRPWCSAHSPQGGGEGPNASRPFPWPSCPFGDYGPALAPSFPPQGCVCTKMPPSLFAPHLPQVAATAGSYLPPRAPSCPRSSEALSCHPSRVWGCPTGRSHAGRRRWHQPYFPSLLITPCPILHSQGRQGMDLQ